MSRYARYVDLINRPTEYATRMKRLSNRIFGEVVRPTSASAMRVVDRFSKRPYDKDSFYHPYYPRHIETGQLMEKLRYYGLYRDEHEDFKEEMERMRALRGKVKKVPYWIKRRNGEV